MKKKSKKVFFSLLVLVSFILVPGFLAIGSSEEIEDINGIFIQDNFAYVCSNNLFIILDVSSPENISEVSSLEIGGRELYVTNNFAFIISYGNSDWLNIIDISNISNPLSISKIEIPLYSENIWIEGDYAYIGGQSGLDIVNITTPEQPVKLTTLSTSAADMMVSSGFAYVVGNYFDGMEERGTLRIYDVSDPANPVSMGSIDTLLEGPEHGPTEVYVQDNYSYVIWDELRIIDCSDKSNLTHLEDIDIPGDFSLGLTAEDNYTYVSSTLYSGTPEQVLTIFDTSDPTNITLVNSFNCCPLGVKTFAVKDKYAYISLKHQGLVILELTDPLDPSQIGTYIKYYTVPVDYSTLIPSVLGIIAIVSVLSLICIATITHKPEFIAKYLERTRVKANTTAIISGLLVLGLEALILNLLSSFKFLMFFSSSLHLFGFLAGLFFGLFANKRDVVKIVLIVSLLSFIPPFFYRYFELLIALFIVSGTSLLMIPGGGIGYLIANKLWKDEGSLFSDKRIWKILSINLLAVYELLLISIVIFLYVLILNVN